MSEIRIPPYPWPGHVHLQAGIIIVLFTMESSLFFIHAIAINKYYNNKPASGVKYRVIDYEHYYKKEMHYWLWCY